MERELIRAFMVYYHEKQTKKFFYLGGGEGRIMGYSPHIGYMGMCHCLEYGFQAFWS